MNLTEEIAQAAITAARKAASGIGVPMNIAVLDAGAHLKAFSRMDGALLGSIDIALGKSRRPLPTQCIQQSRNEEVEP
jgi:uncharacterized protein GlcG (DUF336 family)